METRGNSGRGRNPAAARVRELLRERQRATETHVRAVVDGRARLAALRDQAQAATDAVQAGLLALVELGYSRGEVAMLCDLPESDIPRRRRAGTGVDAARVEHDDPTRGRPHRG